MPINLGKLVCVTGLALAAAAMSVSGPARAYVLTTASCGNAHWDPQSFTYRTSTAHFPSAGTPHAAIESALEMWTAGGGQDIRGAALSIVHGSHTSITTHVYDDLINSVTNEALSGTQLGLTIATYDNSTCKISDSDIILDQDGSWQVYPVIYDGDVSYSTVSLHEGGHAIGIGHENDYPDTMNSQTPGSALIGGWDRAGEDAREGVRAVYSSNSTGVDLAVSPFRFAGSTDSSGNPFAERLPVATECGQNGEARNGVVGASVSRCFCIHDLGTTTESGVVMKLYFSSDDDVIETTDDVVATWSSIQVGPNAPYCALRTFNVPNLASGSYRVGVIIDPGNAITEYDEANNKASDDSDFTIN